MEISRSLLSHYLSQVTAGWSTNHDLHPDEVDEYTFYVRQMRDMAQRSGELEDLRLGFDYLLSHPEIDCGPLATVVLPYSDKLARELISFAREMIWPKIPPPPAAGPPDVTLVDTSLPVWRAGRKRG